ncbi:hypothetical protein [Stutzerimonas nitrititolerans]|uniref:hypothetical protein n=1 Tax=Stutzerimonas nitrititolerans TaxID=2482751 RepID=UPI0028B264F0|nr:hypothetical protein [Stutzerimonas nitrititolerans]
MAQNLQLVLISTGVFVLTGLAAAWVWRVVAHEVANDARLIRELHARLRRIEGVLADAD